MSTAEVTDIITNPDGSIRVVWADGSSNTFTNLGEMKSECEKLDSQENAKCWIIAWWFARSPKGTNTNLIEGKTLTLDPSAANPLRVQ